MEITDLSIMIPTSALIAIGTIVATWQKIAKNFARDRDERDAKVLQAAKEEDVLMRIQFEAKLMAQSEALKVLETAVNKDMDHIKETYNNELKNLGSKIEELRAELRGQHGQLVQLLTKMIDPKG